MSLHASVRCWPLPVNGDHQDFILKVRDFFSSIFMQATIASWWGQISQIQWIPHESICKKKRVNKPPTSPASSIPQESAPNQWIILNSSWVPTKLNHLDGCPRSGEKVSILEQRREKSRCLGPTPWILGKPTANCTKKYWCQRKGSDLVVGGI